MLRYLEKKHKVLWILFRDIAIIKNEKSDCYEGNSVKHCENLKKMIKREKCDKFTALYEHHH